MNSSSIFRPAHPVQHKHSLAQARASACTHTHKHTHTPDSVFRTQRSETSQEAKLWGGKTSCRTQRVGVEQKGGRWQAAEKKTCVWPGTVQTSAGNSFSSSLSLSLSAPPCMSESASAFLCLNLYQHFCPTMPAPAQLALSPILPCHEPLLASTIVPCSCAFSCFSRASSAKAASNSMAAAQQWPIISLAAAHVPPPPRSHAASACTQETCGGQTIWEVGGKEPVAEHLSLYRLGSCARGRLLPCAPAPAALTNPPSALPSHQAAPAASWRCCCFPLPATAPRAAATPDTSDMQPSEALCARKCKAPGAMPALIGKMLHTRRRPLQSDGRTHYCLLHPPSQGGRVRKHGKVWEEANATMEVALEVGKGMKACMRASGRMYQRRDSLP